MATNDATPTHRALTIDSRSQPATIQTKASRVPFTGSIGLRILASPVLSYAREAYGTTRNYPFPLPFVPGSSAIGRVAQHGPDTTSLPIGGLVFYDPMIRARDAPSHAFLVGLHAGWNPVTPQLVEKIWRDGTCAEYSLAPLENVTLLNETRLCNELGYTPEQLSLIGRFVIPYGGLDDIGLKAGETIVIAPATGDFGTAAVSVALAMGARVIAMGRDAEKLAKIVEREGAGDRLRAVKMTGNAEEDTKSIVEAYGAKVEAYFDIAPPAAAESTHYKSCIMALAQGGRASFMGGAPGKDYGLPIGWIMFQNLTLKGTWMYTREQRERLIKLVDSGALRLDKWQVTAFSLDDWDASWTHAEQNLGHANLSVIKP